MTALLTTTLADHIGGGVLVAFGLAVYAVAKVAGRWAK